MWNQCGKVDEREINNEEPSNTLKWMRWAGPTISSTDLPVLWSKQVSWHVEQNSSNPSISPAIIWIKFNTKDAKNSYNSLYLYILLFAHLYTLIEINFILKPTHLIEDQQVNNDFINMEALFPISRMQGKFFFFKVQKKFLVVIISRKCAKLPRYSFKQLNYQMLNNYLVQYVHGFLERII